MLSDISKYLSDEIILEFGLPVYYVLIDGTVDGRFVYKCTRMKTVKDIVWAKNLGVQARGSKFVVYHRVNCLKDIHVLEAVRRVLVLEGLLSESE